MAKPVDIDKLRSIQIGARAMPSRKAEVARGEAKDAQFAKDAAAYRRLRKHGLQPPQVDGSAEREARATEAHEVEGKPDPKLYERASA